MGKKVRSAKGELVDFDLLKIKEQMASAPPPTDVRARQDFIERRLRRRLKKVSVPAPAVKNPENLVQPKLPGTEELNEEPVLIDSVDEALEEEQTKEIRVEEEKTEVEVEEKPKKTTKRRQRARPLTPPKPEEE